MASQSIVHSSGDAKHTPLSELILLPNCFRHSPIKPLSVSQSLPPVAQDMSEASKVKFNLSLTRASSPVI